MAQTPEHLFCHCSLWRDRYKALWKAVGKATGWKAGRCRHIQDTEVLSMRGYKQVAMSFLVATEVRQSLPKSITVWSRRRC